MCSKPSSYIKPPAERVVTLATSITIMRIALIPFVVVALYLHHWGQVLLLFGIAALSDILDGSFARLRNEQTVVGACLDPLADKLLLLSCFATLASLEIASYGIPIWFFWLIFCKEVMLVGSVVLVYLQHGTVTICPTKVGKLATVIQMLFVMTLITAYFFSVQLNYVYSIFLFITSSMTIISFFHYAMIWYRQQYSVKE